MGRKKRKDVPKSVDPTPQSDDKQEEPEYFDPSLLKQPVAVRQRYFEDECIIEHPYLEKALDEILHAICSPGKELDLKRLGLMALVIGPTRVGKTTLIKQLQEKLSERAKKRMLSDPDFIPFAFIDLHGSGRFEWIGYYKAVLRQLRDPFLDLRIASLRTRDFLEAMEEALIRRKPYAVIVDEAQHLAKAAIFKSVLWALQRQLPVKQETLLVEKYWEFLYARSIGCIGFLKMHLNLALERALSEEATTVTEDHLRATAPAEDRVNKWMREALEGEEELFEKEGADERLLKSLGLRDEKEAQKAAVTTTPASEGDSSSHRRRRNRKPGDRIPGRDKTGEHTHEGDDALAGDADEEEAAG